MKNKNLRPRPAASGIQIQTTRAPATDSFDSPPTFCLRYMESSHCVTACDKNMKSAFASTLRKLSQLTWKQINQADRHGCGTEIIPREIINAKIPSVVTDETNLIAFRYCGKLPMVGFRGVAGVFHVIWLDRDFTLYPHG